MCTEPGYPHNQAAVLMPRPELDVELPDPVALAPVDAVTLTTLVDNSSDLLLADQGPVIRAGLLAAPSASRLATSVLDTGETFDIPLAQHGFAMLVTVTRAGVDHYLLFDAGMTPDGLRDNMRRLGLSLADVEVIVLSHGHSDHVTGLDGFIRAVGRGRGARFCSDVTPSSQGKEQSPIPGRFTPRVRPARIQAATNQPGISARPA
jgi:7,8-dihydropterin-6-yl-methyl-4-(beta-D-ribofuranosyl)aminobenzene 5'-phosphate synthase